MGWSTRAMSYSDDAPATCIHKRGQTGRLAKLSKQRMGGYVTDELTSAVGINVGVALICLQHRVYDPGGLDDGGRLVHRA